MAFEDRRTMLLWLIPCGQKNEPVGEPSLKCNIQYIVGENIVIINILKLNDAVALVKIQGNVIST